MDKKTMTCIVCPMGCQISVETDDGAITNISGHTCKRGADYARMEAVDPRRTLTTTVRVLDGGKKIVSVKSQSPLPKALLFESMGVINKTSVQAPVEIGDTVIGDILGTGIDIIATGRVDSV